MLVDAPKLNGVIFTVSVVGFETVSREGAGLLAVAVEAGVVVVESGRFLGGGRKDAGPFGGDFEGWRGKVGWLVEAAI